MLRDVFYYGAKPNVHPREKFATSLEDARSQCTTEHFWIINEYCDYSNFDWDFDFEFLPDEDVWAEEHNNVWPSQHQKDSGTWLCSSEPSEVIIYRADVEPIKRKNIKNDNWVLLDLVDETKFDFSWHPDPTDPPYIYKWGCKYFPVELQACLEYHVTGATLVKYMDTVIELLPQTERWVEVQVVDKSLFDISWRPSPLDPPMNYVWGNKHIDGKLKSTLEYHMPGATDTKYMPESIPVLPEWDRWEIADDVDKTSFDFTWRPDPREPDYIYVWGNKNYGSEILPTISYIVPNATEVKHMSQDVKLSMGNNWVFHQEIDKTSFDLSWRPNPTSPPYIYVWGNKYIAAELKPTLEYHVPDATEYKYMDELVIVLPEQERWKEVQSIDKTKFDLSWRPDPREPAYIYVWGNKHIPGSLKSTLEYHCVDATEYKYMDELVEVMPEKERWNVIQEVDNFDFTWRPDPREPAYIYTWGNKWISGELKPTLEYHCPGATERKYMSIVDVLPELDKWKESVKVDKTKFDMTWRPDPREPAYIYVWGNKYDPAEVKPTIEYYAEGATEYKYMGIVDLEPEWDRWKEYVLVDRDTFDFSWRPDPNLHEPPYIYVWGNRFHPAEEKPTIEYVVPGATEYKYMGIVDLAPEWDRWKQLLPVERNSFDYRWRPDPNLHEPPLIYVFGNKWNDSKTEPTIEYHVPGAEVRKYMDYPIAIPKPDMQYWTVNNPDDLESFDFSWRPNPFSPPQIYQWADNGPRYTAPEATDVVYMERTADTKKTIVNRYKIKTTLEELINEHPDEVFWAINPDLSYDKFDFTWRPNEENFRHINVFGNEYSKDTQTYYINGPMYMMGYKEYNYVEDQSIEIDSNLSMFFIDRSNSESNERFNQLKLRYPKLQKTRYLNSWVDTINRCINKSETKLFWVLNSELDYTDFEFDFYPSPWQMKMIHVFGTQWSHWGTTYVINKETFAEDTKYIKIIEHLSNLNFVKQRKAKATNILYDIVYIDHGNKDLSNINNLIVKYEKSYFNTFKNLLDILPTKKEHYVWVVSTICDYADFDFTYICDPFAKEQLHVFPSDKQKFGDTFLIDVNKLRTLINDMTTLEDYNKINFNQNQRVKRLPAPVIVTEGDTHVSSINTEFNFPYAVFVTNDNKNLNIIDTEPMSVWSEETKNIAITSIGGTRIVVPKEAKDYVKKELYDYPYIVTSSKAVKSNPLDIIFFSNGESCADGNYEHLLKITRGLPNKIIRIDGINGRVKSQHAAANSSDTSWYFLVNAKLKVTLTFDFSWQPDRLQIPKHYIFHATNPVNGLVYGHQAIVANNKKLTLENFGTGLDFTMDSEHEVVAINSGIGMYNSSEWDTWRTAFRECIKLKASGTEENSIRLNTWLTVGQGNFANCSLSGAKDAIDYYNQVDGDFDKLRLSYDWAWLEQYYKDKYK